MQHAFNMYIAPLKTLINEVISTETTQCWAPLLQCLPAHVQELVTGQPGETMNPVSTPTNKSSQNWTWNFGNKYNNYFSM